MNHSIRLKLVLGAAAVLLVLAAFGVPFLSSLPLLGFLLIWSLVMMFHDARHELRRKPGRPGRRDRRRQAQRPPTSAADAGMPARSAVV